MKLLERIVVQLPLGLRLRSAAQLVHVAQSYRCGIKVENEGRRIDARSLLGLMSLGVKPGSELFIYFDGEDAMEASQAVLECLEGGKPQTGH